MHRAQHRTTVGRNESGPQIIEGLASIWGSVYGGVNATLTPSGATHRDANGFAATGKQSRARVHDSACAASA